MAECYYEPTPATDGATMNPVPGATFQVYEIADTTFSTPLSLRVGAGNPTTTVTASESLATLPGVHVTSPNFEHIWVSGGFQWRRDSIDGAKAAIQDAKVAAVDAAASSDSSAQSSASSAQAAKDAAALVDAPADQIMADVAANPSSAFGTQLSATYGRKPVARYRNNYYGAVGDSITSFSGSAPLDSTRPGGAHHVFAGIASGGRMLWTGAVAGGGQTLETIVDEFIPGFIARFPHSAACIVLAGTNNTLDVVNGGDAKIAELITKLNAGYDTLIAAGIEPIAATIPPRNAAGAYNAAIPPFNRAVAANAVKRGLDLLDYYNVLVDPDTGYFKVGYYQDDVHPSPLGHKVMGEHAAAVLAHRFPPRNPALLNVADYTPDLLNGAGLFLSDSNSDGLSDGWTITTGTGFTPSRTRDRDGVIWQHLEITPEASGSSATLQYRLNGSASGDKVSRTILHGDEIRVSGKVKIDGLDATAHLADGPQAFIQAEVLGTTTNIGPYAVRSDITGEATFEATGFAPPTGDMIGVLRVSLGLNRPPTGGNTLRLSVAKLCVENLTALAESPDPEPEPEPEPEPVELYSLGVTGETERYSAETLTQADGETVPTWASATGTTTLTLTSSPSAITMQTAAGIGKYLRAEATSAAGGRLFKTKSLTGAVTVFAVTRCTVVGADYIGHSGYGVRRAGGSWQLAGAGSVTAPGGSSDWTLLSVVGNGASSSIAVNGGTPSGPGTITAAGTGPNDYFGASVGDITTATPMEIAELVVFNRVLDSTEQATVIANMKAHYTALP